MIDAVVFDLDGTLVDLPINYEALKEKLKAIMHLENVRPLVETVSKADAATRRKIFLSWDKAELAVSTKITVNAMGMKLYREHVGKRKALVTLQGKKVVQVIVERFGLAFDVVLTREDSLFRAEQLRTAVEKLGVQMGNVLFVGNAEGDAAAAEKVGCQFQRVK